MGEPSLPINIVLTGFMGAGKTAVGREVASRLGRPFVDMDDTIVARAQMSVPDIFARHGEAHFRQLERDVICELAEKRGLVIATGGGALVDAANRELMVRTSLAICLTASVSAIAERVGGGGEYSEGGEYSDRSRPLLAGDDVRRRIADLLSQRAAAYAEVRYRIDTTGRSVAEVADDVITLARQGLGREAAGGVLRLPVATPDGGGYDVLIGRGVLAELPALLAERNLVGPVAIVSDEHVAATWAEPLRQALAGAGYPAAVIVLPSGEAHKTLATVARIYEALVAAGIDRNGSVLALGGGVVGDMAGFAAATYLRGVAFVQAPTSLLAMVDASVGGKVGVDLPQGKNLVGAFKQPRLVAIDPEVLASLPAVEFRNGLAEVVKHGVIADPELFAQLEGAPPPLAIESLVARALRVKIAIVQRDPFEHGERAFLNLGHTFAHAFEQVSHYAVPHGQAVALGVVAAAHLAAGRGACAPDLPARITAVMARLGLSVTLSGYDAVAILRAMATDKKRQAGRLRFVLPQVIGQVALYDDVTAEQVLGALVPILT